jgi:type IV pilus assembly protein PilQ
MTSMFALWTGVVMALGGPVTEVAITPSATQTIVLISVDGDVEYREFSMEGPNRLVVDLMGARHALPRENFADVNRGGIQSVRTSQYSDDVVRVVLVLSEKVGYAVVPDPRGLRITLENPSGQSESWTSGTLRPTGGIPQAAPATTRQQSTARRISMTFNAVPINDVLLSFSTLSGKSIVPGSNVAGLVTATIQNQPWDVALGIILSTNGLVGEEDDYGIIRIDNIEDLNQREEVEPIITKAHRINYATAGELQQAIQPLLSSRGQITTGTGTNTLIVSDIDRVQVAVATLLSELDVRTPQVSIQAKIIFVNRTDLQDFGVSYEIKDLEGNQFNSLSAGGVDADGSGAIDPGEVLQQGEQGVSLSGASIAALGNATNRVASPTLSILTSLVIDRFQLVNFFEALQSVNLSDIQAVPQVTVLDNVQARIKVGTDVPVRTIDAGAAGAGGGFPTAQVTIEETGIILEATPHVTNTGNILLELSAERSSVDLAESDVGFIKQTQEARTRVLVEDGGTVVIGGLTQTERSEVRSGIPFLMDLPFVGALFRVTRESNIQRDLIILVTPHIVRGTN